MNDNTYDQLLKRMTSFNDHWKTWMTIFMTSYWITWHIKTNEWPQWQYLWPVTEAHDIIYWPLKDLNDNLYDKLLNHMTYKDQWMTSMTNLMSSYWNAWHHKMTNNWLEGQSLWPVTESRDIIWWPLNELNDNTYDQLLSRMTSYNDHWMTWMTILMTSYWIAWHHIVTIEWLEWQSIWQVTESHDI